MANYAGADWLQKSLGIKNISPLGKSVADLLGELFAGIYHIDTSRLRAVDWSNNDYILISLYVSGFSTFDYDNLTRLVFLAHHLAIRVEVRPCNFQYLRLLFHQRNRSGNYFLHHPTLDQAVANFKKHVSIPEFFETTETEATNG